MSAAVVEPGQHEPGLDMMVGSVVGPWFPAGNVRVGVRQFIFDRCCTGRGGALVSCRTSSTTFNASVQRGTTGVVVGRGINKNWKQVGLELVGEQKQKQKEQVDKWQVD